MGLEGERLEEGDRLIRKLVLSPKLRWIRKEEKRLDR